MLFSLSQYERDNNVAANKNERKFGSCSISSSYPSIIIIVCDHEDHDFRLLLTRLK